MVDFGGWHMPLQYSGILVEHKAVREKVGLFDVSHMGEIDFLGPRALEAVQRLITNDVTTLSDGKALYTAVCDEDGGIVDDCIVYRMGSQFVRIVVNASNIDKDYAHFRNHAGDLCTIINRSTDYALIAIQGPEARTIVANLAGASTLDIGSFCFLNTSLAGRKVVAARTGYTGEDGFELFVEAGDARGVWDALVDAGALPIGLGARDTLRLEAKLCLYGNDIDATTTPYEAALGWVVKPDAGGFVGRDALLRQRAQGIERKLVGFKVTGRGIARPGAEIVDGAGRVLGRVTSGGVAPTIGGSIGIAYVPKDQSTPGTALHLRQRNKTLAIEVVKGPFYRRSEGATQPMRSQP